MGERQGKDSFMCVVMSICVISIFLNHFFFWQFNRKHPREKREAVEEGKHC
jgi:hypothetical protein